MIFKAYIKRLIRKEVEAQFQTNIQSAIEESTWNIDSSFRSFIDREYIESKVRDLMSGIFKDVWGYGDKPDPLLETAFIKLLIIEINKYQVISGKQ
jgi:hypothetical protein